MILFSRNFGSFADMVSTKHSKKILRVYVVVVSVLPATMVWHQFKWLSREQTKRLSVLAEVYGVRCDVVTEFQYVYEAVRIPRNVPRAWQHWRNNKLKALYPVKTHKQYIMCILLSHLPPVRPYFPKAHRLQALNVL